MADWLWMVLFVGGWFALQRFLLPKLGVPT